MTYETVLLKRYSHTQIRNI